MYAKALRCVAIIVSCNGSDENAKKAIKGTLRENGKLILNLSNRDLSNMLEYELNGNLASEYLYNVLDEMLIELENNIFIFKMEAMLMKIFVDTGVMEQSAHFGWQNKDEALYGLREGYKNSADELVEIAVNSGGNPKILDTFIFPVLFSYRHCLEISLKHIYMRAWGKVPSGGHNLLTLWDIIKTEIIDKMICSREFIEQVNSIRSILFSIIWMV